MRANNKPDKKELADFKRLVEVCTADPARRRAFDLDPGGCLDKWGLQLDCRLASEGIKAMEGKRAEASAPNPYLLAFQQTIDRIHWHYEQETRIEGFTDERFRAWYQRRIAGYGFSSRISRQKSGLFYIPVAFELSEGCSIGCPFCCLAAKRLKGNFLYSRENGRLWRRILQITGEKLGPIARMAVCYFATEPFDNPDYEKFLQDYHQIFARYPQTTTAVLQRDAARTKEFFRFLGREELAYAALRGSILSLEQLDQIHREFSSEELEHVELLPNNPESSYSYSRAGRSIALSETMREKAFTDRASSVCVCGFVVSLAKKTVMLVSPHIPDSSHPLGMKVYQEQGFDSPEEYRKALESMMEHWMPLSMPEDQPLGLAAPLSWEQRGYILRIQGDGTSRSISLSHEEYRCFVRMIEEQLSLQDILETEGMNQFQRQQLIRKLNTLYNAGCLEEIDEEMDIKSTI